jgi:hypothetical protein
MLTFQDLTPIGVSTADPETLLRWSERVLSAPTLEAVFAE